MTEPNEVLSLLDAERLAERTLAAIDNDQQHSCLECPELLPYIRERVASDLEGLSEYHSLVDLSAATFGEGQRCSGGLRQTAALYGVSL